MLRLLTLLVTLFIPTLTSAMEFTIKRVDFRPVMPVALRITAEGEIVEGDTEKLAQLMTTVDTEDVRDVTITFNSPGGLLQESLELGAFLSDMPAIVSAYVGSADTDYAICASACVYAYLGADYRYLSDDAQIGVHRFGIYDIELDGQEGAALGQAISSILSEYLRANRAEPEFFEKISKIDHDDIYWVSRSELEQWRVVTNHIFDETSEYINVNGKAALQITQIAITGDSHLTLFCTDNSLAGLADLHEPEAAQYGGFEVSLDGEWYDISDWEVVQREGHRGRMVFEMPPSLTRAAMNAASIGARVTDPREELFFGFEHTLSDNKLRELVEGCPAEAIRPKPKKRVPVQPAARMIDQFNVDFLGGDLTRDGIRDISFARCKQICLEYAECQAVSYVRKKSWCWPKGAIRRQRATSKVISAYKR